MAHDYHQRRRRDHVQDHAGGVRPAALAITDAMRRSVEEIGRRVFSGCCALEQSKTHHAAPLHALRGATETAFVIYALVNWRDCTQAKPERWRLGKTRTRNLSTGMAQIACTRHM